MSLWVGRTARAQLGVQWQAWLSAASGAYTHARQGLPDRVVPQLAARAAAGTSAASKYSITTEPGARAMLFGSSALLASCLCGGLHFMPLLGYCTRARSMCVLRVEMYTVVQY
eukprot:COSAG03_NODE_794_length_5827_cov_2.167947_5_plen_113_part_00